MCTGNKGRSYNPKTNSWNDIKGYEPNTLWEIQKASDIKRYGIARKSPFERDKEFFKRIGKIRQAEVDAQAEKRNALIAQQQAQSQQLQSQMVEQQQEQIAKVADLQQQQQTKLAGIQSRGESVVSSLRILGQKQPMAPTASQTAQTSGKRGVGSTQAPVARGSARSRGTNLSI